MSLAPPQNSFRAIYRSTFRTRSVVVTCEGDHIVIRDAETEQETERVMRETMRLEGLPGGLFLEAGNGKGFQVQPNDTAIARALLASQVERTNNMEDPYGVPPFGVQRWQYAVLNVGMFNSAERMQAVLARTGYQGWELAAAMDKASNWFNGLEKGFLLLKRPVPEGYTPKQWSAIVRG